MAIHERIEINPKIMLGKPIICGTRIAVELIVRKTVEGVDEQALLLAQPNLKREDIQAALQHVADAVAHEDIAPGATG